MTTRPTLVVIRHLQIGDRVFHHGDELPPDALPQEAIDLHLDLKQLVELDANERRSIYRLLHRFSGCSEKERLSNEETAVCAL
jgi:hypothetical protein